MNHYLLTGATGLLGGYLLRDMLLRDMPVAVIVRPSKYESAAQRIDSVLGHWEQKWKRWLPRPVVLEGDLTKPGLGLDAADRQWIQHHCRSVLHSAASLAFEVDEGEPWRTNVDGLANLLTFCEEQAIREFLHISTAYICGLREGLVLESELDVGQEFGNVYEESKVAGEKLVRDTQHLDSYTIFRPAIIVGDTADGFSTTFHGFYTPLRLLSAFADLIPHELLFSMNHMEVLGLEGHERKNFVPVQWVSEAIVNLIIRQASQGRTFTLAAEHPVRAEHLNEIFSEAIKRFQPQTAASSQPLEDLDLSSPDIQASINTFMETFEVYRSYWRDDAQFDMSNTLELIPDIRSPKLTDEVLLRLCQYAIQHKFAWKPTRYMGRELTARDYVRRLQQGSATLESNGQNGHVDLELVVTGPGGGRWSILASGSQLQCVAGQRAATAQARLHGKTYCELALGNLNFENAIANGQLLVSGGDAGREVFRRVLTSSAAKAPNQLGVTAD